MAQPFPAPELRTKYFTDTRIFLTTCRGRVPSAYDPDGLVQNWNRPKSRKFSESADRSAEQGVLAGVLAKVEVPAAVYRSAQKPGRKVPLR